MRNRDLSTMLPGRAQRPTTDDGRNVTSQNPNKIQLTYLSSYSILLRITLSSSVYQENEFIEGGLGMDQVMARSKPPRLFLLLLLFVVRSPLTEVVVVAENPSTCRCSSRVMATIINIFGIVLRNVMINDLLCF